MKVSEIIGDVFISLTREGSDYREMIRISKIDSFEELEYGTRIFYIGEEEGEDYKENYSSIMNHVCDFV